MKQFPKHPLTMSLAERESEILKFETQGDKTSINNHETMTNPSVSSDKEFKIIAITWTSRVKPINRDFFSLPSEYD